MVDKEFEERMNRSGSSLDRAQTTQAIYDLKKDINELKKDNLDTQKWIENIAADTRGIVKILDSFSLIRSFSDWLIKIAAAGAIVWALFSGWFHK